MIKNNTINLVSCLASLAVVSSALTQGAGLVLAGERLRVSKDDVCSRVLESQSLSRDHYVSHYQQVLANSNGADQVYAAWALGQFQSPSAVEAIFSCRSVVTNDIVLREMCQTVYAQFGGMLPGFDDTNTSPKCVLNSWADLYHTNGYEGLLVSIYNRMSQTEEGKTLFIAGFSERYDPRLVSVLLAIYPETHEDGWREKLRMGILNSSGYDVGQLGSSEIAQVLKDPTVFEPRYMVKRYISFFRSLRYKGTDADVLWKVILTTDNKTYRDIACRTLRYLLEE